MFILYLTGSKSIGCCTCNTHMESLDIGAVARSCRPLLTVSFCRLLKSCLSSAITSAHLKQTSQQSTFVEMSFQSLPSIWSFQILNKFSTIRILHTNSYIKLG